MGASLSNDRCVLVLGEMHLHRLMSVYRGYYNATRTHLALENDAPLRRPVERFGQIIAQASTTLAV